jgi:glycosyltransferase involved in cell wall biosynthesis
MIEKIRNHYSVIYTGGVQMGRGIQVVFDAIPEIVKEIPDFQFVIVGDGYAEPILKERMAEKNIQDYVLWVGWVDHRQIFDYIRACRIGIIPHFVTDHVNTTIPNKIFDYMGLGLPVIASDAVPMERVLQDEDCGITFRSGDAADLKRAVIEIARSQGMKASNGITAVRLQYNWGEDAKRLLSVIQGAASRNSVG